MIFDTVYDGTGDFSVYSGEAWRHVKRAGKPVGSLVTDGHPHPSVDFGPCVDLLVWHDKSGVLLPVDDLELDFVGKVPRVFSSSRVVVVGLDVCEREQAKLHTDRLFIEPFRVVGHID